MTGLRRGARVRAPELRSRRGVWIDGPTLQLADLRGRFVLLDFWSSCCGNCLHVIDELRSFEATFADLVTVVGVHSPKFPHEEEPATVVAAVRRNGITHPVYSDPDLELWRQYAVRAWPTLVLIDPAGYVVAQAAGEGQVSGLARIVDDLAPGYDAQGALRRGILPPAAAVGTPDSDLRFPAGVIPLDATLLVADTGHHQLVELAPDGRRVLRRIGSGRRGRGDGAAAVAEFAEPNGLTRLPLALADRLGYDVLVADTVNHLLRGVRLSDGWVSTALDLAVAVTSLTTITGSVPPVPSPWDVTYWDATGQIVVAAAGVHLLLGVDLLAGGAGRVRILAGTTVEGLRDGAGLDAWLAQPSGLAADGERLWFVDAETSALRHLTPRGDGVEVTTVIGEGLFDFGHVDGDRTAARLQHPLGVTLLADRSVAVLDTYNGAVRRLDPATGRLSTLADGLAEPSGAVLSQDDDPSRPLLVVESAANRLSRPTLTESTVLEDGATTPRPPLELAAGPVTLTVGFTPPPGRALDDRDGPAVRLEVTASPPGLLRAGTGSSTELRRTLDLALDEHPEGVLNVTAQVATCDHDPAIEHPACHLARQDWGVPVRLATAPIGFTAIDLVLLT